MADSCSRRTEKSVLGCGKRSVSVQVGERMRCPGLEPVYDMGVCDNVYEFAILFVQPEEE